MQDFIPKTALPIIAAINYCLPIAAIIPRITSWSDTFFGFEYCFFSSNGLILQVDNNN
jgi:hypothetical protein